MTTGLNCPNCSAPLDVKDKNETTIRCLYCNTLVIVPEEFSRKTSGIIQEATRTQADISKRLAFIKEMALAGNRITAIKAMRETFEISILQANNMVESMSRGEEVDFSQLKSSPAIMREPMMLNADTVQHIVELVVSGDKVGAIKLFSQATGAGLKEAKDTIDGMAASLQPSMAGENADIVTDLPYPETRRAFQSPPTTLRAGRSWIGLAFIIFIALVTVIPILFALASRGGPLAGMWARINPFAPGRVTLAFGKEGSGPGYFSDPRFIAVDNNGHIFVGESEGGRIQVFDETGKYLAQWKATGEESGDIYLTGLAAGRDGAVYTVVGSQLYVYDGLKGNLIGRLDHPDGWGYTDVSLAPDGSIVAAWYKNRDDVLRFNQTGQIELLVENAIGNVTGDSEIDTRLAVDGSGNIYALAYFNEAVFIFSPKGQYISRFGSMGDARGQFTSPRSIAVDNLGKIYIADFPGVMVYASDGRYLDTIPVNGAVMGMTFDDQNNLYVVADNQVLRLKLK